MNINKYEDVIKNCRFCFMCRHLSGTANVTFREADTPRVRAAMIYSILKNNELIANEDLIRTVYEADMSRACTFHCVSHYDENGLLLAARQDIAEAGLAPASVKETADKLEATAEWKVSGSGDVLYFEDKYSHETTEIGKSFAKIAAKAKISYRTVSGGCIGKALKVLGFVKRAKASGKRFAEFINALNAKTLVVSNPSAYDGLVNDFREYGIKLNVKVVHSSEFIAGLGLKFRKLKTPVYYLESDFLKNYNDNYKFPRELLKQLNAEIKQFGTNNEESYSGGEGAIVLPSINKEIATKLEARIASRADDPAHDLLVTASPYTRYVLPKYAKLNVVTLEELAAANI